MKNLVEEHFLKLIQIEYSRFTPFVAFRFEKTF